MKIEARYGAFSIITFDRPGILLLISFAKIPIKFIKIRIIIISRGNYSFFFYFFIVKVNFIIESYQIKNDSFFLIKNRLQKLRFIYL